VVQALSGKAGRRHVPCSLSPLTKTAATGYRAHESSCDDSTVGGFTIFEALLVIIIIFVMVASLIPKVGQTLGHARVNRAAYVVAGEFMLAQSLAARQRMPVSVAIDASAYTATISQAASPGTVLRTDYFDLGSEFKLGGLTAVPASVQVMPNGTASTTIVVTVGGSDYFHQVTMTQAGQVRITR
jgi:type II secretory pathway pseudopilin PulG